jgi:hypothetical protein
MFDFVATLEAADRCVADGDFSMASFNYWLIGYAVRHEEDMVNYSIEIEEEAAEKFLKYAYEHKDEILTAESYLKLKSYGCLAKEMANFERVINSIIRKTASG